MSQLSDEQVERFRGDGVAFVAYVDAMIRACAPPNAEVSKKYLESNAHRWVVRLGGSDEILEFDYRVVAVLVPPAVVVLHGNTDAGAVGGAVPQKGTFIELYDMAAYGLGACLRQAFREKPNKWGLT
jgi:hypothetical protein